MDEFDVCIVGAGVIGLALAYELGHSTAFKSATIALLERESTFGQHISSRNSEVIHAGIYYPTDSLKAKLCVDGNRQLYQFCQRYDVPHKKTGKLIVGQHNQQEQLHALMQQAEHNQVCGLDYYSADKIRKLEPELEVDLALYSGTTGIIDSHSFMNRLLQLAQQQGCVFAPNTHFVHAAYHSGDFMVSTKIPGRSAHIPDEEYQFKCRYLINSAGLAAQQLASEIAGINPQTIPALYPCKGDYFSYQGKSPFSHLIYPLPERNTQGLGIHATLDMAGQLRFGPDIEYQHTLDYRVNESSREKFATAIRRYFPAVERDKLHPDYAGIRPKLSGPSDAAADFHIQNGADQGLPGLIQLFGIESPGLTCSLSLAKYLTKLLEDI